MQELVGTPIVMDEDIYLTLEGIKGLRDKGRKFLAKSNMGFADEIFRCNLNKRHFGSRKLKRYALGFKYTTVKKVQMEVYGYDEPSNTYTLRSVETGSIFEGKNPYFIRDRYNFKDIRKKSKDGSSLGDFKKTPNRKKLYSMWGSMIDRCYNPDNRLYHRYGGRGVFVCEEWKVFSNYRDWCEDKLKDVETPDEFDLDKDILQQDNLEYGPDTCCIVPRRLNRLLSTSNKIRGDLPIGVSFCKERGKYEACMKIGGSKKKSLGRHETPEKAFAVYKKAKEKLISELAMQYYQEGLISEEVRDALLQWEVVPFPN